MNIFTANGRRPYNKEYVVKQLVYLSVTVIALWSVMTFAQTSLTSPIPLWPVDGNIPRELDGKFVFLDAATGQLVIAVPENFGTPDFANAPGRRNVQRFDLNSLVQATVDVTVQETQNKFRYAYRVNNSSRAKHPITNWHLALPAFETGDGASAPANWKASPMRAQASIIRTGLGTNNATGVLLSFFKDDPRSVTDPFISAIHPGGALSGFEIASARKPGFTTAFVRGGQNVNLPSDLPSDLPPEVHQQAAPALAFEFNSQPVLTLGPKFDLTTPNISIVQDFHLGLQRLVQHRLLDRSPAVQEALSKLETYLKNGGSPLQFNEKPAPGLETEILSGMKLSLQ